MEFFRLRSHAIAEDLDRIILDEQIELASFMAVHTCRAGACQ